MRIAIITARGGSKRIPRKNVREFLGKPLIAWTIENLLASELFDNVCVSTDDQEISEIAVSHGGYVPFLRDSRLSDDFTPTNDVVVSFIEQLEARGIRVSDVCVAFPAAVGFGKNHLEASRDLFQRSQLDYLFTGVKYPHPIERAWRCDADNNAFFVDPTFEFVRTQDLEDAFYDAGQIYWWREGLSEVLRSGAPLRRGMYEISRNDAVDIDTEDDWAFAEELFRSRLIDR